MNNNISNSNKSNSSNNSNSSNKSNNSNNSNKSNKSNKSLLTESRKSFLNLSSLCSGSENIKFYIQNEEKLNYYKNILNNYKIFEKYLREGKNELYSNLKKYKREFFYIHNFFNKQVFIIDGENLLKSFKMQNIFKTILGNIDYYKYFNHWIYGSKNLSINPFTTLNLSIYDKKFIIEKFSQQFLPNFNNIFIISAKSTDSSNVILIDNSNSMIIPIIYQSKNIREQDDHIILFLNKLLIYKNAKIISCDKFKWFNDPVNVLNFRFVYNYNNEELSTEIVNYNVHDLKIFKNNSFLIDNFVYPFIDLKNLNYKFDINNPKINLLINILDYIYIQLKINNNNNIIKQLHFIINYITEYKCHEVLEKYLNTIYKFKKYTDELNYINNDIIVAINEFKYICDCYLIIKTIIMVHNNLDFIVKVAKLYSKITNITDFIDTNASKIRKFYSQCDNVVNPTLEIYSNYILLKKNGFFKKDIL